jgi:uncharacterized circularly permuted ATP-grasp superfamily protein
MIPQILLQAITLMGLITPLAVNATGLGYDEIFEKNGNVRPQYQQIYDLYLKRYSSHEPSYLKDTRAAFQGDNALDPMPRLLTTEEYETLRAGVHQRAQAILAFLKSYHSGRNSFAQAGVIPVDLVDKIAARSGDIGFKEKVNPKTIAFLYGPDVIRDQNGEWRVIEDNLGFIGGTGDLNLAQELMFKSYPELAEDFKARRSDRFYETVAESYKKRAESYGGRTILYMIPTYSADNEDQRISKIFASKGIETITPQSIQRLDIRDDGVYLKMPYTNAPAEFEKVGFIVLNAEHAWVDPQHKASRVRNLMEAASNLLREKKTSPILKERLGVLLSQTDPRTHLPDLKKLESLLLKAGYEEDKVVKKQNRGLLDAALANKVGLSYTPGVDFVGDKEMYLYIEDLIRFYLHEEPILKNIETDKFSVGSSTEVDTKKFEMVFSNLDSYVIKKVDGRGGDSVWVGPKITENEIPALKTAIETNPDVYIYQKYTPLSTANNNIVDLRVIADVSNQGIIVTETPWGRGLPKNGNGKVNISDQGREISVVVVDKIPSYEAMKCSQLKY